MELLVKSKYLIQSAAAGLAENAALFIKNGVIAEIGDRANDRAGADTDVIDFGAAVLAPGLVDSHVHLVWSGKKNALFDAIDKTKSELRNQAIKNMQAALICGVTTVRDCGGIAEVVLPLAEAVRQTDRHMCLGTTPAGNQPSPTFGPRIVASGAPVTIRKGHLWFLKNEAEGAEEVRLAAEAMAEAGADFIKVIVTGGGSTPGTNTRASQYSRDELDALVSAARLAGLTITGHAHGTEGIELAVDSGFDGLEHCTWLARNGSGFDYRPDITQTIIDRGIFVCKTMAGFERWPIEEINPKHQVWGNLEPMRSMVDAGVKFIAGTDAGIVDTDFTGLSLTLETMVGGAGMSPGTAFASATETAADALGMARQIGTLQVGKAADCIVVDENPLEDIRALRKIRAVLKNGVLVARDGRLC